MLFVFPHRCLSDEFFAAFCSNTPVRSRECILAHDFFFRVLIYTPQMHPPSTTPTPTYMHPRPCPCPRAHACAHAHAHAHVHALTHVPTPTPTPMPMPTPTCMRSRPRPCPRACACACTHTHVHALTSMSTPLCMCSCLNLRPSLLACVHALTPTTMCCMRPHIRPHVHSHALSLMITTPSHVPHAALPETVAFLDLHLDAFIIPST